MVFAERRFPRLCVAAAFLAASACAREDVGQTSTATHQREIVAAAMNEAISRTEFTRLIVVGATQRDATAARMSEPERWESFRRMLPSLDRTTYDSFWSAELGTPPKPLTVAGKPVEAVSSRELAAFIPSLQGEVLERHVQWEAVYPGAWIAGISTVGLSEDLGQGLVYVHNYRFPSGTYYLFKRDGQGWHLANEVCTWQE